MTAGIFWQYGLILTISLNCRIHCRIHTVCEGKKVLYWPFDVVITELSRLTRRDISVFITFSPLFLAI